MSNNINTQSGERLSFYQLFTEKKYRILIPIIQRDYAQGRKNTKEIRETFLNALYNYLEENIPNRDLDFVYGSLLEYDNQSDFVPLDGQQRLTTLFLLHWYLCQISNNEIHKSEFKNNLCANQKSMFSYETRTSSAEFCDALIINEFDFTNLLKPDVDSNGFSLDNELSKSIMNSSWFFLSWQHDPTIQAMLTMLDSIHKRFQDKNEFFERLINNEEPIITFLFLNLKDFDLTDDLYIKMNSRGKPLTSFENFKAKFEQYLEKLNHNRSFYLAFNGEPKKVSLNQYFSHNIDTKWANLFWNYKSLFSSLKVESVDNFDDEVMNFIRVVIANQYAMKVSLSTRERDDALEYILGTNVARKDKDYSDIITFSKYLELKVLSDEAIYYVIDAFDCLVNGSDKIKEHLSDEYQYYYDENKVFQNVLRHNFETNHERLCFHSYLRFLIKNKGSLEGINQWMRVCHNLSHPENTIIDSASDFTAAVKSIEGLLPFSTGILEHLKENPVISVFSSWQVLEEKIKAHLITKDNNWKNAIESIEKHNYFNGQIGFILELSGILDYFNYHLNCAWSSEENIKYYKYFCSYSDKASCVFDESYENRKNDLDYVFERAVLTKGDYLTNTSQYRKNLLSTNLVKNNIKRDHSWKRLLRITDEEDWKVKRMFVKNVFDDNRFDITNLHTSLSLICKDRTNSWRDNFIKSPRLIQYCNQGFIRFENDNNILLYGESQSNHIHAEMYTYYLWNQFFESNKVQIEPFKRCEYKEVKSIDETACIVIDDYYHNRIRYKMEISYYHYEESNKPYIIAFKKALGDQNKDKFGQNVQKVLTTCDFEWNDGQQAYIQSNSTHHQLIKKLNQLLKELNTQLN